MTEPTPDSPQDLAAAYVLGALSPDEASQFEALLARSPEVQDAVAEFRETAALLAIGTPGPAPAAELRHRVLTRLGHERGDRLPPHVTPHPRHSPLVWGALAASLIAVLGLGAAALSRELAGVRAMLTQNEQAFAELQRRLGEREATLTAIFKPSVQMFQLTSTGDPDPRIQLFWDRERHRAIVHGLRLRPLPAEQAYELWFIQNGKAVPSVTFKPAPNGDVQIENIPVPSDGTVSAAAVTVEPSSGSPQPTSPVVITGSLGKTK